MPARACSICGLATGTGTRTSGAGPKRKEKGGARTYTAVPEDRDIAFFKGDGVLPFLISRKFAVRNFQNFGKDFGDYKGLNQTALSNDRTFMGGVTREQWVAQATSI